MNKVTLLGRLTQEPILAYSEGTGKANTKITLAINRKYKNAAGTVDADFINCIAFDKLAEVIANNVGKGERLLIEGAIRVRKTIAEDGSNKYITSIVISTIEFIEKKNNKNKQDSEDGYFVDDEVEMPF